MVCPTRLVFARRMASNVRDSRRHAVTRSKRRGVAGLVKVSDILDNVMERGFVFTSNHLFLL